MHHEIIRLTAGEVSAFRELLLEGLKQFPEHFASTYAEESCWALGVFEERLRQHYVAGCYHDDRLVAIGALVPQRYANMGHRAMIASVYVTPQSQHRGVGKTLIKHLLEEAAKQFEQVHIAVGASNQRAIALYESLGFEQYGYEPRAAKLPDGRYIDDKLLLKRLI